jgi:hypothetical protein
MTPDLTDVTRRLERLERQNRRLKLALLTAVLAVGVGTLVAADKPEEPKKQHSSEYLLSDEKGNKRATLSLHDGQPALRFFDERGVERGRIQITGDGLTSRFYSERGTFASGSSLEKGGLALLAVKFNDAPQIGPNAVQQTAGVVFSPEVRRP